MSYLFLWNLIDNRKIKSKEELLKILSLEVWKFWKSEKWSRDEERDIYRGEEEWDLATEGGGFSGKLRPN